MGHIRVYHVNNNTLERTNDYEYDNLEEVYSDFSHGTVKELAAGVLLGTEPEGNTIIVVNVRMIPVGNPDNYVAELLKMHDACQQN